MRKFIVFIPIVLIFLIFLFASTSIKKENQSMTYKALKIILNQNDSNDITLNEISIIDTYPLHYDNNYSENFLKIEVIDKNNQVLFQGKEMIKDYLIVDQFNSATNSGSGIYNKSKIVLLLPYFPSSDAVILKDSDSMTKLKIQLKDYNLILGKEVSMCGNGICDKSESFLSCFRDCNVQLTEFFKKSVP